MEKKINIRRLLITLGIIFLTALTVGGITWYAKEKVAQKEKEAGDKQIEELERQLDLLRKGGETEAIETKQEKGIINDNLVYKNTKYGFELSYPPTHYLEERNQDIYNVIIFSNKYKGTQMGVPANSVYVHPKKSSDLGLWVESEFGSGMVSGSLKKVVINNLSGYYFQTEGMGGKTHSYVFENSSKTYAFVLHNADSPDTISHTEFVNNFKIN